MTDKATDTQKFWNELYGKSNRIWSGRANQPLIDAVSSLQPGRALDLGCGEGGDAVWLAKQGWQVMATDVSDVALARTKELAAEHGVTDKIELQQHDFELSFPSGTYDLISAQYLQSPLDFQRKAVLQKATAGVAPNGKLIIVEHAAAPSWSDHHNHTFPTAQETFDSLKLDAEKWEVETVGTPERETVSPAGEPATIKDNVIIIRRVGA